MKKNSSLYIGGIVVLILVVLALLTPYLGIIDPNEQSLQFEYQGPMKGHPMGFGENGVDMMSQVLWGARISLGVGFGVVFIASFIGLVLGSIAGYKRGWIDLFLMRVIDVLYAFPGILLVVALAAFLGPSIKNMMFVMIITSWAGYARLVRGIALSLREREYITAAKAVGCSTPRILVKHLWPNLYAPLLVQLTFGLGGAILTESSLSFLGLGAPPGTPSWGQMLNYGREVMTTSPHAIIIPGVALVITVLALNLLGDGLRDLLDPRLKIEK